MDTFTQNREKTKSDKGYMNWSYLKYFLTEYEETLQTEHNMLTENKYAAQLELVFPSLKKIPQNDGDLAEENRYFNQQRNKNWEECIRNNTPDRGQQYLAYTLGNIILVNRNIRDVYHSFEKKKDRNASSFNEDNVLDCQKWTPIEILNRGLQLLSFLEKRWDITINERDKREILYLNRVRILENDKEDVGNIDESENEE